MKCPNCNKEIDEGSAFCTFCGKPVEVKPAADEAVKMEEDTPIVEEKVEEVLVENEPIIEENSDAAPVQEEVAKKPEEYTVAPKATSGQNAQSKKRHSIITIAILGVVILLAIIIGIVCLSLGNSPEKIYKSIITSASN